jgi:hypothetical protein
MNKVIDAIGRLEHLSNKSTYEYTPEQVEAIYYEYGANDDFTHIIEKFADDFARLYKDFLLSGTLHDFCDIKLSYGEDVGAGLEEYESCISTGCL